MLDDQGNIGLCKQSDGNVIFVEANVLEACGLLVRSESLIGEIGQNETKDMEEKTDGSENESQVGKIANDRGNAEDEEKDMRTKWNSSFISLLINLRCAKYAQDMNSTSTKCEVTWKKIAEEISSKGLSVTSTQCYNKWRYLKARYSSKKDNMKTTGSARVDFNFFEEMDEYFGKKPNFKPISVASSMKGDETIEKEDCENGEVLQKRKRENRSEIVPSVRSKKTVQDMLAEMQNVAKEREKNKEKRHQELLASRQQAINVFQEQMMLLRDKMGK